MATKKPTAPKKRKSAGRKRPPPKARQSTSAQAIIREKAKELILTYRLQGYTLRAIKDAVNAHFGPEGEEPLPGFKPVGSVKTIHEWCEAAISEIVDPLKKEQLREIEIAQLMQMLTAHMPPALQGSTPHADMVLKITDRLGKINKLYDEGSPDGGGTTVVQYFIGGELAGL